MKLEEFLARESGSVLDAIRAAWCEPTAAPGAPGAGAGKPHGQCAVTALLVQDLLGGTLMRADMGDGTSHYWNLIPAMGEVDLTREQYDADRPIPRGAEVPRARLLVGERAAAARTPERYEILRNRFFAAYGPYGR